jgi:hypothetical protein
MFFIVSDDWSAPATIAGNLTHEEIRKNAEFRADFAAVSYISDCLSSAYFALGAMVEA